WYNLKKKSNELERNSILIFNIAIQDLPYQQRTPKSRGGQTVVRDEAENVPITADLLRSIHLPPRLQIEERKADKSPFLVSPPCFLKQDG
ncbi:hypothetical protein HispidOSU_024144, partial [Sigmodon hispidus]